jgi:hypothetical protein
MFLQQLFRSIVIHRSRSKITLFEMPVDLNSCLMFVAMHTDRGIAGPVGAPAFMRGEGRFSAPEKS